MSKSIYKLPKGYATLMAFYMDQLARWPVPYESRFVSTRYGETHLIASGAPDAPPLILLRGAGDNALLWAPLISQLSRSFRTYAVDVIGEAGQSAPTRPAYRGSAYGEWLVELFDALKLERTNVAGTSRGGWLTLKIAQFAPERINGIVPLCAEGIAPVRLSFLWQMLPVLLWSSHTTVQRLLRFLTPPALAVHPALVEERLLVYQTFRQSRQRPPLFTDAELRQIQAPTLLLYGDYEQVYNLQAIRQRVVQLPANFQLDVIPHAGHVLDYDQPEAVSARMMQFLQKVSFADSAREEHGGGRGARERHFAG